MHIKDRDHARKEIEKAGISHSNITTDQLRQLRNEINAAMIDSGNYRGTYGMDGRVGKYMTCSTEQWEGREAVSFNSDGFIGFAGWADDNNIRPILDGVGRWVDPVIS